MSVEFDVRGQQDAFFVLWTCILARSDKLKLKCLNEICYLQTCNFSLHKMLIDELDSCRLLMDYCFVLIRCLNFHFDGTYSLHMLKFP